MIESAEVDPHYRYTPLEVASILRVGRGHVYDLITRGELRAIAVGRSKRIKGSDLLKFEHEHSRGGPKPRMEYTHLRMEGHR